MPIKKIDSLVVYTLVAPESVQGVFPIGAEWRKVDLASYSDAGSSYETAAREVMDGSRQLRKGVQSNKTVNFGYNNEITQNNVLPQVAAFMYGVPNEKYTTKSSFHGAPTLTSKPSNAITSVTESSATATEAVAASLRASDLIIINSPRNSTKLQLVSSVNGSTVEFTPFDMEHGFIEEPVTYDDVRLQKVGFQMPDGDCSIAVSGSTAVLTSAAGGFGLQELSAGEWIFVGGDANGGANRFDGVEPFYARILNVTNTTLVLDTTTSPVVSDAGAGKRIHIYVGTFIKNGDTITSFTHARYLGLDDDKKRMVEVFTGCTPNEMSINLSEASFASVDLGYLGIDHKSSALSDAEFASTYPTIRDMLDEAPYHTASSVYRQRLAVKEAMLNPSAITSFVQEGTISIANNLSAATANGHLGAFDYNVGDFTVTGSVTAYFVSLKAVDAIRCGCTLGMDVILAAKNTGVVIDMPSFSVGGGIEVEKGSSIKLSLEQAAFRDSDFGFTLSWTAFPYLPSIAMPLGQSDCTC